MADVQTLVRVKCILKLQSSTFLQTRICNRRPEKLQLKGKTAEKEMLLLKLMLLKYMLVHNSFFPTESLGAFAAELHKLVAT